MKVSDEYFRRLLASEDAIESIAFLAQFWTPRAVRLQRAVRFGLSEPEFNVHVIRMYDGEVTNGGHSQFFLNPSGAHVSSVLAALDTLGLDAISRVLVEACSVFLGASVPSDPVERAELIEQLPPSAWQRWTDLDREYYTLNQELDCLLLNYLRTRADEVLVPERAP